MPLAAGSRLGPYEVLSPLGAGGMGEVFRARDSRLGRDVAIKILPAAFAGDPERLARFEREARLLASLSHANIAGIHGLEVVDGHRHLVLEFVDGMTLADRLKSGPLAVDEVLSVGAQIAAGLDAAHEAGIVHRDLKPGNVMLTPAGNVKVLDFGLARGGSTSSSSSELGLSASPTMTYAATMAGVILGTAAYMSPEQARGRAVDRRTDIWSFGCVLYECLTGKTLFAGETVSDTIAKILEREPDWSALPARTPARVRELLVRCLEKDARKRQRDAGDIQLELEGVLAGGLGSSGVMPAAAPAAKPTLASWLPWGVAAVATLVAIAALVAPRFGAKSPLPPPIRSTITLPREVGLLGGEACDMALSPDGKLLAFAGSDSANLTWIWVRPLDNLDARRVARSEGSTVAPFWSPDSRQVGFFADGKLKVVALDGNPPLVLCDAPDARGGTWNRDGVILFTPTSSGPIHRVSAAGGASEPALELDTADGETTQRFPRFLPDGRHFTFVSLPKRDNAFGTWVGRLGSKERHRIGGSDTGLILAGPDRMVFGRGNNLMAQACDPSNWSLVGEPFRIGIVSTRRMTSGGPAVTASTDGLLIYPAAVVPDRHIGWLSRDGSPMTRLGVPKAPWGGASLGPDGRQAIGYRIEDDGTERLWMIDTVRGTAIPFGGDPDVAGPALWSPDGRDVFYGQRIGGRAVIVARPVADGAQRVVLESGALFANQHSLTPDGRYLVFRQLDPVTKWDCWYVPTTGGTPTRFLASPEDEVNPIVSPDGRWVLFEGYESGRAELYLAAFPSGEGRTQVTSGGGLQARWVRDTWEILYVNATGRVVSMSVTPGSPPEFGNPVETALFQNSTSPFFRCSVTNDGRRLLTAWGEEDDRDPMLTVLANWRGMGR